MDSVGKVQDAAKDIKSCRNLFGWLYIWSELQKWKKRARCGNPRTREAVAGESGIQSHPWLQSEFEPRWATWDPAPRDWSQGGNRKKMRKAGARWSGLWAMLRNVDDPDSYR